MNVPGYTVDGEAVFLFLGFVGEPFKNVTPKAYIDGDGQAALDTFVTVSGDGGAEANREVRVGTVTPATTGAAFATTLAKVTGDGTANTTTTAQVDGDGDARAGTAAFSNGDGNAENLVQAIVQEDGNATITATAYVYGDGIADTRVAATVQAPAAGEALSGFKSLAAANEISLTARADAAGVSLVAIGIPTSDPSLADALWNDGGTVVFSGSTAPDGLAGSPETYTESNVVTDRAFDATSMTFNEMANILGSLIVDLRARGVVA